MSLLFKSLRAMAAPRNALIRQLSFMPASQARLTEEHHKELWSPKKFDAFFINYFNRMLEGYRHFAALPPTRSFWSHMGDDHWEPLLKSIQVLIKAGLAGLLWMYREESEKVVLATD